MNYTTRLSLAGDPVRIVTTDPAVQAQLADFDDARLVDERGDEHEYELSHASAQLHFPGVVADRAA